METISTKKWKTPYLRNRVLFKIRQQCDNANNNFKLEMEND